ncbi:MAG: hypothetical protein JWM87_565 [Candidatus Eremiobacteraeota bacterium]|nr:hypothetical protein [Candidatus Eremiobacteraeota bacterium]
MRARNRFALVLLAAALASGIAVRAHAAAGDAPVTEEMGGHMDVTRVRPESEADRRKAGTIVSAAKRVMTEYPTVADAERAGFKKFLPGVRLPEEHYTNDTYALEAWRGTFDPEHPTSLIFERHGESLTLAGVMYTANKNATEQQLDAAVPLGIARWHRHVRFCWPPPGVNDDPRFGFAGSITDEMACRAAGGRWMPELFGWMVHVWPLEHEQAKIWAVHHGEDHTGMGAMHGMMH